MGAQQIEAAKMERETKREGWGQLIISPQFHYFRWSPEGAWALCRRVVTRAEPLWGKKGPRNYCQQCDRAKRAELGKL